MAFAFEYTLLTDRVVNRMLSKCLRSYNAKSRRLKIVHAKGALRGAICYVPLRGAGACSPGKF